MWRIRYDPGADRGLLSLELTEHVAASEMRELAAAHAQALESTGGQPFRVLLDLRGLYPLDGPSAELLADMKRVAASLPGYEGRAVLVDSATIAMQQRNATVEDGGDPGEIITQSADEARQHVR